jgi:hypothetical protein
MARDRAPELIDAEGAEERRERGGLRSGSSRLVAPLLISHDSKRRTLGLAVMPPRAAEAPRPPPGSACSAPIGYLEVLSIRPTGHAKMSRGATKRDAARHRLVVDMRYDLGRVYVRHVVTHAEYDRLMKRGLL